MPIPRVTIFMPVYNGAAYLEAAIRSILDQTYRDFEFLVIDDGSTDKTPHLLETLSDPRIRIVRNDKNLGVPATRNLGMDLARGEFLAAMDSDDVAHPERIAEQVRFLDRNPDHAVVGSWARETDEAGNPKKVLRRPVSWELLRARLLFEGTIRTPTTLGRLEILKKYHFDSVFPVCSDSDFWVRVALDHRCANLPQELIRYRIHNGSLTKSRTAEVRERKIAISKFLLERLGVKFDQRDLANHYKLRRIKRHEFDADYIDWAETWLRSLIEANRLHGIFPKPEFAQAAGERWYKLLRVPNSPPMGLRPVRSRMRGALLSYYLNRDKLRDGGLNHPSRKG